MNFYNRKSSSDNTSVVVSNINYSIVNEAAVKAAKLVVNDDTYFGKPEYAVSKALVKIDKYPKLASILAGLAPQEQIDAFNSAISTTVEGSRVDTHKRIKEATGVNAGAWQSYTIQYCQTVIDALGVDFLKTASFEQCVVKFQEVELTKKLGSVKSTQWKVGRLMKPTQSGSRKVRAADSTLELGEHTGRLPLVALVHKIGVDAPTPAKAVVKDTTEIDAVVKAIDSLSDDGKAVLLNKLVASLKN